jgi:orotidine-5'-phosphate decarboxylase
MLNVHALGGERMLLAAREGLAGAARTPKLVAVTILTSLDAADLAAIGLQGSPQDNVIRLAVLADKCGLDGVVCSSLEAAILRKQLGDRLMLVTPGIRPAGSSRDDQRRIMTPLAAMQGGASYLVIGRPVTQADDPVGVLRTINSELASYS